jgi:excisionase family DNA binding protein
MKIEIDNSQLINDIVEKVVARLKPLLGNSHDSERHVLMTVSELAGQLKVKESWVYEKIHTRGIPFKKIGKFPRFRKRDIDIWIDNPYHPDLSHYNLRYIGKGVNKI